MSNWGKRARRALVGLAALALLAGCGGGTEQITEFRPQRYFAFGDEMSVLTRQAPLGRKYTVNGVGADGVSPDCAANTAAQPSLLWTQLLGGTWGFIFAECNPANAPVTAFGYAAPGAKADDFVAQLAAAGAVHGRFGCNDLVSVLVGANDVIDLYENIYLANPSAATANAVNNELNARAARLAQAIADLTANNGANAIVSTIPMMNLTPYARQQALLHPNVDAPGVLSQFSTTFNTSLRTHIPNDGSRWGLVELDAMTNAAVNQPQNYGLANVTNALCTTATPDCDNVVADLVPGGNPTTWLWATDRWIGWQAHNRLGSFARARATGNPFGCS